MVVETLPGHEQLDQFRVYVRNLTGTGATAYLCLPATGWTGAGSSASTFAHPGGGRSRSVWPSRCAHWCSLGFRWACRCRCSTTCSGWSYPTERRTVAVRHAARPVPARQPSSCTDRPGAASTPGAEGHGARLPGGGQIVDEPLSSRTRSAAAGGVQGHRCRRWRRSRSMPGQRDVTVVDAHGRSMIAFSAVQPRSHLLRTLRRDPSRAVQVLSTGLPRAGPSTYDHVRCASQRQRSSKAVHRSRLTSVPRNRASRFRHRGQ